MHRVIRWTAYSSAGFILFWKLAHYWILNGDGFAWFFGPFMGLWWLVGCIGGYFLLFKTKEAGPFIASMTALLVAVFAHPISVQRDIDFAIKQAPLDTARADIEAALPPGPSPYRVRVPAQHRWLIEGPYIYLDGDDGCRAIFFVVNGDNGDTTYGYLHAPDCFEINDFDYNGHILRQTVPLNGQWYWIRYA